MNERDWKTLTKLMLRLSRERHIRVSIEWEPGKVSANAKAVDKLAKRSSAGPTFGRARPTNGRRKLTTASVEVGSVRMEGQLLRIHMIQPIYLSRHETRYRYEVVDAQSPYDGKVDFAESDLTLAPGHFYDVRMNADQGPRGGKGGR